MAEVQQNVTSLISKVKKLTKGGWSNAKGVVPKEQGMTLPGNIRGGVARLTSYKIGESDDKDRAVFVSFRGVVLLPKEHATERFFKTIYITDKPEYNKTMQDALNDISAAFQNLGVDTTQMTEDHWEPVLQQLCEVKRAFSFHTWSPPDSDRVTTFIDPPQKKLEDYQDLDPSMSVDGAEQAEPEAAPPPPAITKPAGKPAGRVAAKPAPAAAAPAPRINTAPARTTRVTGAPAPKPTPAPAPAVEEAGGSFLDEVIAADADDQVVDFGADEPAAEMVDPNAPWVPDVGTIYNFFTGKHNPDGSEVLHEVEVMDVSADGLKFTGKSVSTQRPFPGLLVSQIR